MIEAVQSEHEIRAQLIMDAAKLIAAGDLAGALRMATRAKRLSLPNSEASLVVARLLIALDRPQEAVRHILAERTSFLRAELDAALIDAYRLCGQFESARERLQLALERHSVDQESDLALAAHRFLLSPETDEHGWIGFQADLRLVGEVSLEHEANLTIAFGADPLPLQALRSSGDGYVVLQSRNPVRGAGWVTAGAAGKLLIGSDLLTPPDFNVRGRSQIQNGTLTGWVEIGWSPRTAPTVELVGAGGVLRAVALTERDNDNGGYRLNTNLRANGLAGGQVGIAVQLPSGEARQLDDSPALAHPPPVPKPTPGRNGVAGHMSSSINIIIPVFKGRAETLKCLASVLSTTRDQADVIVVDDGSPDSDLKIDLDQIFERGRIRLIRNAVNRGFPHAVNRGFAVNPDRDIVILNADTEVYGDWLERMSRAAYSSGDIGTVTPLSNSGSITSYPSDEEWSACTSAKAKERDDWVQMVNRGMVVDLPTGVGFCLYIKRACLNATGPFDPAAFGRGYGEENDFCMRAAAIGWRHVAAADVYVRHHGSRSFGEQRAPLQERNSRLLSIRHPNYDVLIEEYHKTDPLRFARRRLNEIEIKKIIKPTILFISASLGGGVDHFLQLRGEDFRKKGFLVLTLQLAPNDCVQLKGLKPEPAYDLIYKMEECDEAIALLEQLDVQHVELHHFLDLAPQWIDRITGRYPYSAYIHDYSWYCPRLTLLGGRGIYCGEPDLAGCQACIDQHGSSIEGEDDVAVLRARSHRWLLGAQHIVSASDDTAGRYQHHFPDVKIEVQPWESDKRFELLAPVPSAGERIRIAVVGAIGDQKGSKVLLACAHDAHAKNLPIDFVLIGFSDIEDELARTSRVFITGRYQIDDLADILSSEQPHIGFIASVTPETWSFTLSQLLAAGIPVAAFDIGIIGERLRRAGLGSGLMPLNLRAADVNDRLLNFAFNRATNTTLSTTAGHAASGDNYTDAPRSAAPVALSDGRNWLKIRRETFMQAPPPTLRASAHLITLSKGMYMFTVDPTSTRGDVGGEIALPSISLAPAPGSDSGAFHFLGGLRTEGAWLHGARDIHIVKVTTSDAMLLVTSYTMPNIEPLNMEIERIDRRQRPSDRSQSQPSHAEPAQLPAPNGLPPTAAVPKTQAFPSESARGFRIQIVAHIANRGDMTFVTPWAGALAERLPIESFTIAPLEGVAPNHIEYMAILANGVETPWIDGGAICGTQRQRTAVVGFAVRMKANRASPFVVEYSGRFTSGRLIGPLQDGRPCHSDAPGDALYALNVVITERPRPLVNNNTMPADPISSSSARNDLPAAPRFSSFRE